MMIPFVCAVANAVDDLASLLQSKRVVSHSQIQYAQAVKTVIHSNATSERWTCAYLPCEELVCTVQCPEIACDCFSIAVHVECPTCCAPDNSTCLESKMKTMMDAKMAEMKADLDYEKAYARWERTNTLNARKDTDAQLTWMKTNLRHMRKLEDKQYKDAAQKRIALQKAHGRLKKHIANWARDLSDEVATVQRLMNGGVRPPRWEVPGGHCSPGPICPLPKQCPLCHKQTCPPCQPVKHPKCKKACPEDHHIRDAIDAALKKEDFVACPPMGEFCNQRDSWPKFCPMPRIMCHTRDGPVGTLTYR